MNIIHPDVDYVIINNCHLIESLPQLACVNSWFSTMIKNNILRQEYKIGYNKKFYEEIVAYKQKKLEYLRINQCMPIMLNILC